jgi:hypothetical protein
MASPNEEEQLDYLSKLENAVLELMEVMERHKNSLPKEVMRSREKSLCIEIA